MIYNEIVLVYAEYRCKGIENRFSWDLGHKHKGHSHVKTQA